MRLILAGALITLGVFKLNDITKTNPSFGIPLTIGLGLIWIIEVLKEFYKGRR